MTYVLCPGCNIPMRGSVTSDTGVRCPKCRGTGLTGQKSSVLTKTPFVVDLSTRTPPPSARETEPFSSVMMMRDRPAPATGLPQAARSTRRPAVVRAVAWVGFLLVLAVQAYDAAVSPGDVSITVVRLFRVAVGFAAARAVDALTRCFSVRGD